VVLAYSQRTHDCRIFFFLDGKRKPFLPPIRQDSGRVRGIQIRPRPWPTVIDTLVVPVAEIGRHGLWPTGAHTIPRYTSGSTPAFAPSVSTATHGATMAVPHLYRHRLCCSALAWPSLGRLARLRPSTCLGKKLLDFQFTYPHLRQQWAPRASARLEGNPRLPLSYLPGTWTVDLSNSGQ